MALPTPSFAVVDGWHFSQSADHSTQPTQLSGNGQKAAAVNEGGTPATLIHDRENTGEPLVVLGSAGAVPPAPPTLPAPEN